MELKQATETLPATFTGRGYFRQGDDGASSFRIYPESVDNFTVLNIFEEPGVPGKLIERDQYYRLVALDREGHEWHLEHTLPTLEVRRIRTTSTTSSAGKPTKSATLDLTRQTDTTFG